MVLAVATPVSKHAPLRVHQVLVKLRHSEWTRRDPVAAPVVRIDPCSFELNSGEQYYVNNSTSSAISSNRIISRRLFGNPVL